MTLASVCVFCGSSPGGRPAYTAAATAVGTLLAQRGTTVVYGGGRVGLMGALADAALAAGGDVVGVIPQHLVDREAAHTGLSELRVTGSMHERKALMAELSEGFVALPGGLGTLEELFETLTWSQLGLQDKPCGLLEVEDFFARLLAFLDHTVTEGFVSRRNRGLLLSGDDPAELLHRMDHWRTPSATSTK